MIAGERSESRGRLWLTSEDVAVSVLFAAIAILAGVAPAHSDTWWQLRAGEEIWRSGRVSLTDTFSYTADGAHWPNHEWLSEVLFFAVYRVGGMPALTGLCALAITVSCLLSWRLLRGRFEWRFGLFVLGLTSMVTAWSLRPQVFSLACFMATCTLLASSRLKWLPPLFLLWANLHGGVGLGLLAVGAVLVTEVVRSRRVPMTMLVVVLACLAATAVTPLGFELWILLAAYGQHAKTRQISEWMPPGAPPEYLAFWLFAAAVPLCTVWLFRRLDQPGLRLAAIASAALPLALTAHRQVPAFLLVGVPAAACLLDAARKHRDSRPAHDRSPVNTGIAAAVALLTFAALLRLWHPSATRPDWRPIADGTIQAISACDRPFYNSFELGGVLIWFVRDQPVFIDNRNDPYPLELLERSGAVETTGDYRDLFAEFGVRCAAVEVDSPTERRLKADADWRLTHADRRHAVYQRAGLK